MNPFSSKKKQVKLPKVEVPSPRKLEEIQAEYNQLSARAGQNQYQSYVLAEDLKSLNRRLVEVNQEAAERNKLDAAAKAKEDDAKAVKSE